MKDFDIIGNTELDTLQEQGKPTTSNNWGWCADWCGGGQSPARTLKVAISSNFLSSVLFDETVIRKKGDNSY